VSCSLNDYQRNSLSATLRFCEKKLREAKALLSAEPLCGILYRQRSALSSEARRLAEAQIDGALSLLAEVARNFDLQAAEENLAAHVAASMTLCWANLADVRSAKLAAYGTVDARLSETLDPYISRLEQFALAIAALMQAE
jgi:hypothetical protein